MHIIYSTSISYIVNSYSVMDDCIAIIVLDLSKLFCQVGVVLAVYGGTCHHAAKYAASMITN